MSDSSVAAAKKQAQTDHDTLIRVESKVDGLVTDIKEMKESTLHQINEHHVRIIALETWRQTRAADEKIARWEAEAEWTKEFRGRWKWIVGLISIAAAVIGSVVGYVSAVSGWFNR